ncbi:MAG TPA: class I SAM-dependent methyltransferase [Fimbriiglobus sp.]
MTASPNFDRLAPHYLWLERVSFGRRLHRCRTAMVPHVAACKSVLIVGEGDGRFLVDFIKANPDAAVDCIDISPGMTALARQRVSRQSGGSDRVTFHVADVRRDPLPGQQYDLVVTNFLLDCFPTDELGPVVARLAAATSPGAHWIVGDFTRPRSAWTRPAAELVLAGMYFFFRTTTRISGSRLIDPSPDLLANGFLVQKNESWLSGFLTSTLWRRSTPDDQSNGANNKG